MLAGLPAIPESHARSPQEIYGPVFARYKNMTDARKKLRKMEKKGEAMTGDDYFAMAYACQYEEPASQSIILTALSRSACKDKTFDYFVEAGNRGTPEGFLAAAHWLKQGDQAYVYAQMAFQLAGGDKALESDALDTIASLRSGVSNAAALDGQAVELATRVASSGAYASMRAAATQVDVSNRLPNLSWIKFDNRKRCHWGAQVNNVLNNAIGFDDRKMYPTIPAQVKVPGIAKPVTSRITRPEKSAPEFVQYFVDFKGQWNGLTVLGLTDVLLEESEGVNGRGIRFAEPVDVVARKLQQLGFVVNPKGGTREQVDKVDLHDWVDERGRKQQSRNIDGVITTIERQNGETVFTCDEVFYATYGGW